MPAETPPQTPAWTPQTARIVAISAAAAAALLLLLGVRWMLSPDRPSPPAGVVALHRPDASVPSAPVPAAVAPRVAPAPDAAAAHAAEKIEIGVAYGTEKQTWLEWATKEFAGTEEGRRIVVNLLPMGSIEGAKAILDGDRRIHVWSPASRLYREQFQRDWETRYRGAPIVKEEMLALTPMVVVMWKSRYDAFTRKSPNVSLRTIGSAMRAERGWGTIADRPDWGHFKFGHTHPDESNSGRVALILMAYESLHKRAGLGGSDVHSPKFEKFLVEFERGVTGLSHSTADMMKEMILKGPSAFDALMVYESVAIDFLPSAAGRWDDLQIVYPKYNLWNDNPYYILNTPWTTPAHQQAAETLLRFLMSRPIQARALDHGFRPGNPAVAVTGPRSPFTRYEQNGLRVEIPEVCELPSADVQDSLMQTWSRNAVAR